ncbi:MAG: hypothetical protein H6867_05880 [Rhodospirillales bacterium]|nr:hypothetical protein [Rhodospirillales bacterium]MCB9995057.1 hypothetical protein [Rhodospirillales bacterium]
MAFLEQFSKEERDLIVSVPYRAGAWVSSVDEAGGGNATADELKELENIISEKAKGMFESAFVHEVMVESFNHKADWADWAKHTDTILEDAGKAVSLIESKLSEKDVDAYRANIMAIGLNVAKAFREFEVDASVMTKAHTQIGLLLDAALRVLKRDKSYSPTTELNISYEEDVALTKLSEALHASGA